MEESQAQTKIAHGARISHPHCDGDRCYLVVSLVHIMRGPCPKERTLICIIVCLEQDFELPGADFCLFPFGKGTGGNKDAIERTGRIQ